MMKIVAGMGSVDDYEAFARAGADEVFCGYVPESWIMKYGRRSPLNRREVMYVNVQIGSESELLILKKMEAYYHVPVTLAFNSLYFEESQYDRIRIVMERCYELGFQQFIVADRRLCLEGCGEVHVSGEMGELNPALLRQLSIPRVKRFIFPRQTTIEEMKVLTGISPSKEYEAFLLNEKCHFTGAYCNSLHCDELCHLCQVPYRYSGEKEKGSAEPGYALFTEEREPMLGASGCGLCALWKLRDAGVTHLKIVSRGNSSEDTVRDIVSVKTALSILEASDSEESYLKNMKAALFPMGCRENCYYS